MGTLWTFRGSSGRAKGVHAGRFRCLTHRTTVRGVYLQPPQAAPPPTPLRSDAERAEQRWASAVWHIAHLPGVAERLLDEHQANAQGRCRGCRVPGYGTAGALWPCSLHVLASQARAARPADLTATAP